MKTLQEENQIFKNSECSSAVSIINKVAAIERLEERYEIVTVIRILLFSVSKTCTRKTPVAQSFRTGNGM